MTLFILILLASILIGYLILKPYFIRYSNTLLFTGELGAGKTLKAVTTAVKIYKKTLFKIKIRNWFIKKINKLRYKLNRPTKELHEIPLLISNIPIRYKGGKNPKWSIVLTKEMLTFEKNEDGYINKIPEYSVIVIDELPQLINQFDWNIKEIKHNVNEFITFFRHYIGNTLIITAQSDSQVVKQIRDKMNTFYWLSNFRKFLFFFYKVDVCQFMSSDVVANVNNGFIEDNTKTNYGILRRKLYDSRCYSERYTTLPETPKLRWTKRKTNKIIRFDKYKSPLDKEINPNG